MAIKRLVGENQIVRRTKVRICAAGGEMVGPEDVITIYQRLTDNGIQVWLTGGWGIDALLGEQSRPHKDLDIITLLDDVVRMRVLLGGDGYCLKEIWPENRWVADAHGIETATAFVLQDSEGRELDVHAMRLNDRGDGIPAWEAEGFVFKRKDLAGEGMIAGVAVQCLTPEMQVSCHTGYELPDKQLCDLELLREVFGVEYPKEYSRLRPSDA
jgi:lincosamide nucleotidyltransferase A/C/D/E